jgi:glycerol uptake facilitator-like aquaporin
VNRRRIVAEFVATALLLVAIVGSGIVVSADPPGSIQLFQHAVVVGAALGALIFTFGPVSGAHLNPAVTIADAIFGGMGRRLAGAYVIAQLAGGLLGVLIANWMFGFPTLALADQPRSGIEMVASEALATFGLVVVIFGTVRGRSSAAVPVAVGGYIAAAIFFTSSAAFANPAVTVGRAFTDTWTGIAPSGIPGFLLGQVAGTALAVALIRYLFHPTAEEAHQIVVPHSEADR